MLCNSYSHACVTDSLEMDNFSFHVAQLFFSFHVCFSRAERGPCEAYWLPNRGASRLSLTRNRPPFYWLDARPITTLYKGCTDC